jgi:LacI family transcriptional regulator
MAVPESAAVLGVDNDELLCTLALPTLSSVIASHRRCGYLAAEMLHRRLRGERCGPAPLLVLPEGIAERESTATALMRTPELGAAVRLIRARCAERLTVRDVARSLAVSRRRLEVLFREKLGRSPAAELRRCRIAAARVLLRDPRVSLKAVAAECGFSNPRRLRLAFEAETALSFDEWRLRQPGSTTGTG